MYILIQCPKICFIIWNRILFCKWHCVRIFNISSILSFQCPITCDPQMQLSPQNRSCEPQSHIIKCPPGCHMGVSEKTQSGPDLHCPPTGSLLFLLLTQGKSTLYAWILGRHNSAQNHLHASLEHANQVSFCLRAFAHASPSVRHADPKVPVAPASSLL